jgi:hypothetical protein
MNPNETPEPDLRALLSQVAAGTVAPEEASQRITASTDTGTGATTDHAASAAPPSGVRVVPNAAPHDPDARPHSPTADTGPIDRVVIRGTAVKLVLIADSSITGATVQGPHVARRDGGAIVIDTDADLGPGDFSYEPNQRRSGKVFGRWRGGETVIVRLRPELPVEVSVAAGSIVATGLKGGLRFSVDAGSIKTTDCSGPLDGRVASGSAVLDWRFDGGTSRLRCELGSVKMRLDARSDVTVKVRAELGSVDLGKSSAGGVNASRELVVGNGRGTLDVDVSLGSAKIAIS